MEVWKDIIGYEGLYEVSNLGRVKSLPKELGNGATTKLRIMKNTWQRNGFIVMLSKYGKRQRYKVSRLVYMTHKEIIHGSLFVSFKDNDPRNLKLDNLYVRTRSEVSTSRQKLQYSNKKNKYKGVYKNQYTFQALIQLNGKRVNIGSFKTDIEAAKAYDKYVIKHIGNGEITNKSLGLIK